MSEIYLIADTHFGDDSIRKYENRPFESVEEMDEAIIRTWKSRVTPNDKVYVLGDVGVYSGQKMKDIISRLPGEKHLILGNHDMNRSNQYWRDMGFNSVYRVDNIIIENFIVLGHKPPEYMNPNVPWVWMYGHVHGSEMYQTVTAYSACVCAERWGFGPVNLKAIMGEITRYRNERNETNA